MKTRAFNNISIANGLLTKTSTNVSKLKDEIIFYQSISNNNILANLFPEFFYHSEDYSSYTIKYFPYKSLSELIINNEIDLKEGKNIIDKLFNILQQIHSIKQTKLNSVEIDKDFLIQKTIDRIALLRNIPSFSELITDNIIFINDKPHKTFIHYQELFIKIIHDFFDKNSNSTIIHGDFSFSNILYCPVTKDLKLVDPRGSFGLKGIYGHPYYDYAKLMHCIDGKYDYIVNDKFDLIEKSNKNFSFHIHNSSLLNQIYLYFLTLLNKSNFNVKIIRLIESSLFLSMTPLHYEDTKRQKALFLNGLIIINNFFQA